MQATQKMYQFNGNVFLLAVVTIILTTCPAGIGAERAPAFDTPQAKATGNEFDAPPENADQENRPQTAKSNHPTPESPVGTAHDTPTSHCPSLLATVPFATILLCIAIMPLIPATEHWWHKTHNKLVVALVLAGATLIYYLFRNIGFGHGANISDPGWDAVVEVISESVLDEYIPFIVLLFGLYTICGGIQLTGDLRATPGHNVAFLAAGTVLASFIGTTGASMLLIRPLLQTNAERRYKRHTAIFFIFLVSNIGGCLLPIGDPPLFLGYLYGVPFLWTMQLWQPWLFTCITLLIVYYIWDRRLYRREPPLDHLLDIAHVEPLRLHGTLNFLWLAGVVLAFALMMPGKTFLNTSLVIPPYLREMIALVFVGIAWITSSKQIRQENRFNFYAIKEVAAVFIGIFITMQVPIEILNLKGAELGLTRPAQFFWATGILSSFLDNAPTYVVFFETARALPVTEGMTLCAETGVSNSILVAISLGAVFMGANSYIGNGPNFMVKAIAQQSGVPMPSFFGYVMFSIAVLIPTFMAVMFLFI